MRTGSPQQYLFVYGSLRRGSSHKMVSWLAEHVRYVCAGAVEGKLFLVDWYPGFVQDATGTDVVGDIFELTNQDGVIAELGRFEGCSPDDEEPFEFVRKETDVRMSMGETLICWVYHYNGTTDGLRRIEDGDFIAFKQVS